MMRAKERHHKAEGVPLSRRMKSRRALLGLTQEDLAEKAGLACATIAYIEQSRVSPSMVTVERIAEALDCSLDWLVCGREYSERESATPPVTPQEQVA